MNRIPLPKEQLGTTTDGDHVVTIEVCEGEDCFCSGGGAVLLDLEDLVAEWEDHRRHEDTTSHHTQNKRTATTSYRIVSGRCRQFCSMGPNVYVNGQHFTEVQSVSDCESIAKDIGLAISSNTDHPAKGQNGSSTKGTVVSRMMRQKADRLQWQAFRDMARLKHQKAVSHRAITRQQQQACQKGLEQAHQAAMSGANHQQADAQQRVLGRRERLQQKLQAIVSLAEQPAKSADSPSASVTSSTASDGDCELGHVRRAVGAVLIR